MNEHCDTESAMNLEISTYLCYMFRRLNTD